MVLDCMTLPLGKLVESGTSDHDIPTLKRNNVSKNVNVVVARSIRHHRLLMREVVCREYPQRCHSTPGFKVSLTIVEGHYSEKLLFVSKHAAASAVCQNPFFALFARKG
jgi:hypothetical protein